MAKKTHFNSARCSQRFMAKYGESHKGLSLPFVHFFLSFKEPVCLHCVHCVLKENARRKGKVLARGERCDATHHRRQNTGWLMALCSSTPKYGDALYRKESRRKQSENFVEEGKLNPCV
jgi:hypothetical protein